MVMSSVKTIAETNWNQSWEENFEPVRLGADVIIRASFHPQQEAITHDLVIDPKMSFGTGHHSTTRLMLKAMLSENFIGKDVLDMGCGTGVLGIFASRLGANQVMGIDIDHWAVENSRENISVNQVSNMQVVAGDAGILDEDSFDIILANINRNVLLADLELYISVLRAGGKIIISGIMSADRELMLSHIRTLNIQAQEILEEQNWLAIVLQQTKK